MLLYLFSDLCGYLSGLGSFPFQCPFQFHVYVLEKRARDGCVSVSHLLLCVNAQTMWQCLMVYNRKRCVLHLYSEFAFLCKQNWWFKDDRKGHTLEDIKWVLQALYKIQNILVLKPLHNQQKLRGEKGKQAVFLSFLNIIPNNWFS